MTNYVPEKSEGSDHLSKLLSSPEVVQAKKSVVYGPIVERYLQELLKNNTEVAEQAIRFICEAANHSQELYDAEHVAELTDEFAGHYRRVLAQHHENVTTGVIGLVPELFRTSIDMGEAQVRYADKWLGSLDPRVQRLLSDINYDAFTSKTMLIGRMLLDGNAPSLQSWTEKGTQQSMPHLVLSNLAMGGVAGALWKSPAVKHLKIVDMGSGTGTTLAGSLLGILQEETSSNGKTLAVSSIESNGKFHAELERDFIPLIVEQLARGGIVLRQEIDKTLHQRDGVVQSVHNGISEQMAELDVRPGRDGEVLMVTANYVWHRLPTTMKRRIIAKLAESPNAVVCIADLEKNGSVVNRGYFNLRDNGLCNCGNIGLRELFAEAGFNVRDLNEATKPETMDATLAQKIGQGTTSDSFFLVATKGERAEQVVSQW